MLALFIVGIIISGCDMFTAPEAKPEECKVIGADTAFAFGKPITVVTVYYKTAWCAIPK